MRRAKLVISFQSFRLMQYRYGKKSMVRFALARNKENEEISRGKIPQCLYLLRKYKFRKHLEPLRVRTCVVIINFTAIFYVVS